uniref:Reticulocalbin-3 n=1 Tax=Hemiscolopendra marginata TaxID=943146 RepID=A0A646QJC0_9MYRI
MILCYLLFVLNFWLVLSSPPPSYQTSGINKERTMDGAFSHRDYEHYKEAEHRAFDHEAILGSRSIIEEFERLTTEDAKKKLKEIVLTMDKNNDGLVDKEELTNWVMKSLSLLSKEESEERFQEADANADGKVTWKEYVADMYGFSNNADGQSFGEDQKMIKEDKEIFEVSDVDRSGILDKDEYRAFTHPEEYEHTMEVIFKRTLNEKDIDLDGFLNFEEFIGNERNEHDKEWYLSEKDRFEKDFDKDQDGKLNRQELLLWLSPNSRESAEEEADHLIESADDNKDQVLSINEILDHHDVFVGSEITDFGHHLENTHKFKDEL